MNVRELQKLLAANTATTRRVNEITEAARRASEILPRAPLIDPEQTARFMAAQAERNAAPLVTRNAILALLDETRAIERACAKRERWILLFTAATFLVGLAVLLLAVL